MSINGRNSESRLRKPDWLKVRAPGSKEYLSTKGVVDGMSLHTVCREALCPNIGDCWSHHTATFLILGDHCTRNCRFCAVKNAASATLAAPDSTEPSRVAAAVKQLGLAHAVITSVTRDDLPDGGAAHFGETVRQIKAGCPGCSVELLIPDLQGSREALKAVVDSRPDVLNHNLETVCRLYDEVRPQAVYSRSLELLLRAKELNPGIRTKSGIMVGLGETKDEVLQLMDDLRASKVDVMTIGQYLQPSGCQLPVQSYVTPELFKEYEKEGLKRGFLFVESSPFVRSSYHAWRHAPSRSV